MKLFLYAIGCLAFVSGGLLLAAHLGSSAFERETARRVALFFAAGGSGGDGDEIDNGARTATFRRLPASMRRYLKRAGVSPGEKIRLLRIHQRGCIRLQPGADCLPFQARQVFTAAPPAFVWAARIPLFAGVDVHVRDRYENGRGRTQVSAAGLFPVADASGPGLDQGAALRYLAELVWFPSAFLDAKMRWEELSPDRVRAFIRFGDGDEASADFHLNGQDEVVRVTAMREREVGGRTELTSWKGEYEDYQMRGPFRIPLRGRAIWRLPAGDYPAVELELTAVEFDPAPER